MDLPRSILSTLAARPASLADLTAATGASLPTLRRAMADLEAGGWLTVVDREAATGGRPANLFGLNPKTKTVIGVHLAHPGMRIVATNLLGTVVHEAVPEGLVDLEPEAVYAAVGDFIADLRARHADREAIGLGVATPGFIDAPTGTIVAIGRVPRWRNLPLRERLAEQTGLPVFVINDMDALATAEFGLSENAATYAYAGLSEGLKFSFFIDGTPYVGPFGNAGLVAPPLMAEGASQADRSLLQVHGLVDAYLQRRGETQAADAHPRSPQTVRTEFAAILNAADAGEADATELTFRMTDLVAAQAASFVHLLQPGLLVLGGALAGAPSGIARRIEQGVRARLPALINNHLAMRPATVTAGNGTAVGATRAFLQAHLDRASERQPLPARL